MDFVTVNRTSCQIKPKAVVYCCSRSTGEREMMGGVHSKCQAMKASHITHERWWLTASVSTVFMMVAV